MDLRQRLQRSAQSKRQAFSATPPLPLPSTISGYDSATGRYIAREGGDTRLLSANSTGSVALGSAVAASGGSFDMVPAGRVPEVSQEPRTGTGEFIRPSRPLTFFARILNSLSDPHPDVYPTGSLAMCDDKVSTEIRANLTEQFFVGAPLSIGRYGRVCVFKGDFAGGLEYYFTDAIGRKFGVDNTGLSPSSSFNSAVSSQGRNLVFEGQQGPQGEDFFRGNWFSLGEGRTFRGAFQENLLAFYTELVPKVGLGFSELSPQLLALGLGPPENDDAFAVRSWPNSDFTGGFVEATASFGPSINTGMFWVDVAEDTLELTWHYLPSVTSANILNTGLNQILATYDSQVHRPYVYQYSRSNATGGTAYDALSLAHDRLVISEFVVWEFDIVAGTANVAGWIYPETFGFNLGAKLYEGNSVMDYIMDFEQILQLPIETVQRTRPLNPWFNAADYLP